MTRAKTRRPGTRSGKRAESVVGVSRARKPAPAELPEDLPDAAEAALDDLILSAALGDRDEAELATGEPSAADAPEPVRKKPPPAPGARRARTPVPPPAVERPPARMPSAIGEIDDDQLVEETALPELDALRFVVHEVGEYLASAQGAITAAGHTITASGSGAAGAAKVTQAIVGGGADAVLVALPGGESVIDAALALEPRRPVVIAAIAGRASEAIPRAVAAGADLVAVRPHDPERLAPVLLAASRVHHERRLAQNARGAEQVLRAKLDEIADPDPRGLQPFEVFQRVLELEFKRARRFEYPLSVALFAVEVPPPPPPAGIRGILRARAGNALIHTIRDIDLATQLDHERFLVLLPYTDLAGAAKLGRRVIAAVAENDPVISAGRSFPPRVVGAVAGARTGEQLSFAKLMKDATRALEQARRDGAELAVQP